MDTNLKSLYFQMLNSKTRIPGEDAISLESLDCSSRTLKIAGGSAGANEAKLALSEFGKSVSDNLLKIEVAAEGFDAFGAQTETKDLRSAFTNTQKNMAVLSLLSARNKETVAKALDPVDVSKSASKVVPSASLESYDISGLKADYESFDGSYNNNAPYFNAIVNMGSARQEDLVEMFFPTVLIKPFETGAFVSLSFPSYINEYFFDRTKNLDVEAEAGRKPMIQNIYNPKIMGQERTRLVPVNNGDAVATAQLVPSVSFDTDVTGETIKSGYYKANEKVNIITLSQTSRQMALRGIADNTDNILPGVRVENLLVRVKATTDEYKIPLSLATIPGTACTWHGQGHAKDLTLNLSNQVIGFTIGESLGCDGNKCEFGTDIAGKTGWKVLIEINLSGNGNMQFGTFQLNPSNFKIVGIKNDKGEDMDLASGEGKTVKEAIKEIECLGYTLKAYAANTNLRKTGQLIQSDKYQVYFEVDFKSPWKLQGPIEAWTGDQTDFQEIDTLISSVTHASNFAGITRLVNYCAELEHDFNLFGSEKKGAVWSFNDNLVKRYFHSKSVDLLAHIDSLSSHNRLVDMRAALINQIRDDAIKAMIQSNYGVAFKEEYGKENKKITLIIATDPRISQYLTTDAEGNSNQLFALNEYMDCLVLSTLNPLVEGKMFMSFSVSNKVGEISEIKKLHFGFRLMSPATTLSLNALVENNTPRSVTYVIPRYEHHAALPIMLKYEVSGIEGALKKSPINFHTV